MSTCRYCAIRITASATFCPNCGQEVFGKRKRLQLEPPVNPNFTDRMHLQGRNASRLLVALLATLFGSAAFIGLFFGQDGDGMLIGGIAMAMVTMLCALPELRELRELFRAVNLMRLKPWMVAIVVTPFLPLLADLWLDLIGFDPQPAEEMLPEFTPGMALLTICIMPGIFEELAFRGVVFGNLRHMLSPKWAQILTAALFAGMHFNPIIFPYHLLIGLYLGLLRTRSGTLLIPMFAHALHNGVIVFFYEST
ncbi:MAG: type II CAAX endopeptidase family protein [Planctomycetota bacterium]